jgi:hypothetical protein
MVHAMGPRPLDGVGRTDHAAARLRISDALHEAAPRSSVLRAAGGMPPGGGVDRGRVGTCRRPLARRAFVAGPSALLPSGGTRRAWHEGTAQGAGRVPRRDSGCRSGCRSAFAVRGSLV